MLSSKGFWHRDSKVIRGDVDGSLNFGVQVVLHAQKCQQVRHSNYASKGEKGLQNIVMPGRRMHERWMYIAILGWY